MKHSHFSNINQLCKRSNGHSRQNQFKRNTVNQATTPAFGVQYPDLGLYRTVNLGMSGRDCAGEPLSTEGKRSGCDPMSYTSRIGSEQSVIMFEISPKDTQVVLISSCWAYFYREGIKESSRSLRSEITSTHSPRVILVINDFSEWG